MLRQPEDNFPMPLNQAPASTANPPGNRPSGLTRGLFTPPWVSFTWDTAQLPSSLTALTGPLIRPATREEGEEVLKVIMLSLSMDSGWNDSLALAEEYLKQAIQRLFNAEEPLCLVVPKGNRLIAASILEADPSAQNQLVCGPSVIMEYRNRGIGKHLLFSSLLMLKERGLASVTGITRANTAAARYVYPKFGGKSEPVQISITKSGPAA